MPSDTIQKLKTDQSARTYLTSAEVSLLLAQAKRNRYPERDRALILLTYRHGLRASEAVALRWEQIEMKAARIHVRRLKGSDDSVHVLEADELQVLRALRRHQPDSAFVFLSERGAPMTADNFLSLMKRLGKAAGFSMNIHPHQLRHGAGFALTEQGVSTRIVQQFLGHRNIQNTVRYSKLTNKAFNGLGRTIGAKL